MTSDRLQAMRRLVRLQNQVKTLAEHELGMAEADRREVEAAQRDLDAFVAEAPLAGRLAALVAVQRGRLGAKTAVADARVDRGTDALREAKRRQRIAERMVEDLGAEDRRLKERQEFERLLDGLANPRTSLP